MQHPDQKYINALSDNDPVILEELYQKFFGKIRWMIVQNHGTTTDAADIFQEALLSLFNKTKNCDFTLTCPLEAFLYQVCKKKWMKELRKRKTRGVAIHDFGEYNNIEEGNSIIAEESKLKKEQTDLILEKLAELGNTCRKLLELNWKGRPLGEVAQILNVTYAYIRKKKSKCMSRLIVLVRQSSQYNSFKW